MMERNMPFLAYLLIMTSSLLNAQPNPKVWKMTYSVLDSHRAAQFSNKYLGTESIKIPDATLAQGRSWVRFPQSGLELHFVDARDRYGYESTKKAYEQIDRLDQGMTVFTTYMDNHGAILVRDLDPYLIRLEQDHIPFLGPIRRDDGVYQLYIEIPGHAYLELDSKLQPKSKAYTTWSKVPFAPMTKK